MANLNIFEEQKKDCLTSNTTNTTYFTVPANTQQEQY